MAFIVEDGGGIASANSYASVAELNAYAEFRFDLTAYTNTQKEAALVVASSDWIDGYHSFRSESLTETQGLFFPTLLDALPYAVKEASMKAALLQLRGLLLVDLSTLNVNGSVESESKSVGPLSKSATYKKGSAQRYSRVLPTDLTNLLNPYLLAGCSSIGRAYRI
jgi:hypothetical protein